MRAKLRREQGSVKQLPPILERFQGLLSENAIRLLRLQWDERSAFLATRRHSSEARRHWQGGSSPQAPSPGTGPSCSAAAAADASASAAGRLRLRRRRRWRQRLAGWWNLTRKTRVKNKIQVSRSHGTSLSWARGRAPGTKSSCGSQMKNCNFDWNNCTKFAGIAAICWR